jgi:3-hydroxybutyryl-CoA dehydrogenase
VRERVAAGELGFKSGGVGLQTWTAEEQAGLRTELLDYLCKAVRDLKEREER